MVTSSSVNARCRRRRIFTYLGSSEIWPSSGTHEETHWVLDFIGEQDLSTHRLELASSIHRLLQ